MEYIPLGHNIGLSLGEINYDDIQIIDDMIHKIKDVLVHSKRKKRMFHKYIILYKSCKCNMKNRIIICYSPDNTSFVRKIINKSFLIVHDALEIQEIIMFNNQQNNILNKK